MDVDLHPEVMDVGVTEERRPREERETGSWWTSVGSLSMYADRKSAPPPPSHRGLSRDNDPNQSERSVICD